MENLDSEQNKDDGKNAIREISIKELESYNKARDIIASLCRSIYEHLSPPDGEDVDKYITRMSSKLDELLESNRKQKDRLIRLVRDTEAQEASLANSLAMADILLERGDPWSASFILASELEKTYMVGAWRPHALVRKRTSLGGVRAGVTKKKVLKDRNLSIRTAYRTMSKPKRDRTAILARRFGMSASQVRRILAEK